MAHRSRQRIIQTDSLASLLILAACVLIQLVGVGPLDTFGLVLPEIQEVYGSSRASTGWIGSLAQAVHFFMGPVAGYFCHRFSSSTAAMIGSLLCFLGLFSTSFVRHLPVMYFTYGVIYGTGSTFSWTAAYVTIPQFFERWRSVSIGIVSAGDPMGVLCFSPLVTYMLVTYGWVKMYQILSYTTLIIIVLALTFRNTKSLTSKDDSADDDVKDHANEEKCTASLEKDLKSNSSNEAPVKEDVKQVISSIWRNRAFSFFIFASTICLFGFYVPSFYLASHCKDLGISNEKASQLYMIIAVSSICGRLLSGTLCDLIAKLRPLHVAQFSLLVVGTSAALTPLAVKFSTLVVVTILYGAFTGAVKVQYPLVVLDYVGVEKMPLGLGFLLFSHSIASVSGVPLAGFLADQLQSYRVSFYFAGGVIVLGGLLMSVLYVNVKCLSTEREKTPKTVESVVWCTTV